MSIETNADNRKKLKHFGVIGGIVVAIGAIFTLLYLRYKKSIPKDKIIQKQLFPKGMQGLTNEEAEKRQEIKTMGAIIPKASDRLLFFISSFTFLSFHSPEFG